MKKALWVTMVLLGCAYVYATWDYYLSEYKFRQYCESDLPGLFVDEKVMLDEEYFQVMPESDDRNFDRRFLLEGGNYIDKKKFEESYLFEAYKRIPLLSVGPIEIIESSVTRKSDQKVLSRAVSIRNYRGKAVQWFAMSGVAHINCPSSDRSSGLDISEYNKLHDDLIFNTFY